MNQSEYILICDDEAHIRQIVAHKLRSKGYEVVDCRDGQEAFDAALARTPALLITDYQMPRMSGLDLCKALRANPATSATPTLMLTARGYVLTPAEMAATNISQLIAKPFGVRELLDRVTQIIGAPPAAQPKEIAA